ncbi:hypothetical protein GS937_01565 [Rhodococcus hoagii]|uniref:Uncharacterized protein n=1 Tax=Rhodococcus hoagii TaxID=43767 RepID=A0A9Q2S924_RHOHA|nr:hypothetical protein [Prescottella equi]MBM4508909.1 hypothetical protein [Prescottella equi]MBM4567990.1 hypothetical protein [Prescottella equi]NKT69672.1 hypothetical protein [Prescottella equi]NKU73418.1 hypothetical protein [Prescottella equi]
MEADLNRFHQTDLRDLWRPGGGESQLTLRRLFVLIRYLPADSALAIDESDGRVPWTITDHLLADLWEQKANAGRGRGKPRIRHPWRLEQKKRQSARRSEAKRNKFERAKARRARELGTTE